VLDETEISELAKRFADAIPENELSVAALQGYLLKNKVRPRECVEEVAQWVIDERETREKLKKEKAEREAKEKKEAEEKERKEKEEKAAKEQEEKEAKEKSEKKERAKAKKAHRAEAAMKLEGASSSTTSLTTIEPVIPVVVLSASESSSSESDSSNGGIEADTEESVTSEEEPDKAANGLASADSAAKDNSHSKEKWVAVKADS